MKNNTQKVALFDMDGTLTLPRKKISADTITALAAVSTQAKIAVVTGSPIEYVIEQLDSLWGSMGINPENITLMPCNGTKLYKWSKVSNCFVQEYTKDLKKHIDSKDCGHYGFSSCYTDLITNILKIQTSFLKNYPTLDITGNFISYRGSTLNWSVIGRDSCEETRKRFLLLDSVNSIRQKMCEDLRVRLNSSAFRDIEFSIGGKTSIDIYPKGWDKTHCLRHIEGAEVWFWGDSCGPNGNDRTLYEKLDPEYRSFQVSGPQDLVTSLRKNFPIDWREADMLIGNLETQFTVGSD